ncbi:MAG: hypothetical protein HC897_03245 [Thermoanaerobaculia bacterium]|nr:hypothetical protein [Thermoanaerobaculia bacterium]
MSSSSALSTKAKMIAVIEAQPPDSSFDDILRELAFHRLVERGLDDLDQGDTIATEELRRRVKQWPS